MPEVEGVVRNSRSQWAGSIHRFPYRERGRIAIDPRRAPDIDVDSGSRWNSARRLRRLAAHHGRNPGLEMAGPTQLAATLHPDRATPLPAGRSQSPFFLSLTAGGQGRHSSTGTGSPSLKSSVRLATKISSSISGIRYFGIQKKSQRPSSVVAACVIGVRCGPGRRKACT